MSISFKKEDYDDKVYRCISEKKLYPSIQ